MSLFVHVIEKQRLFHIQGDHFSYIFRALKSGDMEHLYYGGRLEHEGVSLSAFAHEERKVTPSWEVDGEIMQPQLLGFEYPEYGHGDYRVPACIVSQANGSSISHFEYQGYDISEGKDRLTSMPSSFDETDDDAQTLTIHLLDSVIDCHLDLKYTVFPHQDVMARSSVFSNEGSEPIVIDSAKSLSLDIPAGDDWTITQFAGAWAREMRMQSNPVHQGIQEISSTRGASSHQHNPFFMVAEPHATEHSGQVIGFNLLYSGDYANSIELDHYGSTRISIGLNPSQFSWKLDPEQSFQTPEAIMCLSDSGFDCLSARMSRFVSEHVVNQHFSHMPRPILINNWEATYFDFDHSKLMRIAEQARDLGIELFVLDDGWFGHRNDATTSLGDWKTDPHKLPDGIAALSQAVHDIGMQFGLWFEPEMISLDSELYRSHPDWLIATPNRDMTSQRNQFVLDMSRREVVDYLHDAISSIIASTHLDYVKWDMNRNITEAYGSTLEPDRQSELPHRYMLGVYDLYARLTSEYPDVLFESCASGGGRFDLGMMYYAPQAWVSDDTDAVERLFTQYGASFGYPQSCMGSHVSAVPNHETGRVTPLATRGNVAFFGDLGYELDISQESQGDLQEMRRQISLYKRYREVFQQGSFHRIQSPYESRNAMACEVVSDDGKTVIVGYFRILNEPNSALKRIRLTGLAPSGTYRLEGRDQRFFGDELMNIGLFIPQAFDPISHRGKGDFSSELFVLTRVDES
ncbi:alpha-galactosidase [Bifidobacterium sp.]|uniref:alpha-galactosidase n=1 Tax=Bifidobacterium sp. TaxID=41200 RepID=UPI0039E859AF